MYDFIYKSICPKLHYWTGNLGQGVFKASYTLLMVCINLNLLKLPCTDMFSTDYSGI